MRAVIITADDFGQSEEVNAAVETACREGVLRAASLMVAAPAAADAVARARRLPELRVGLHLVLVRGTPVLSPAEIPALVDDHGRFPDDLGRAGVRWFFDRTARRQLAREIAAQFAAFRVTGLAMDHVNVHNHLQLHPSVLSEVLRHVGDASTRCVRLPREPLTPRAAFGHRLRDVLAALLLSPWVALTRARLGHAGAVANDWLLGISASGHVDETRLLAMLDHLPGGLVEIHLHPASRRTCALAAQMPGYDNESELAALISERVAERLRTLGLVPGGFCDATRGRLLQP